MWTEKSTKAEQRGEKKRNEDNLKEKGMNKKERGITATISLITCG